MCAQTRIADLTEMVHVPGMGTDMKLGKALLLDSNWEGALEFSDKAAMERFYGYTGQDALARFAAGEEYATVADTAREYATSAAKGEAKDIATEYFRHLEAGEPE